MNDNSFKWRINVFVMNRGHLLYKLLVNLKVSRIKCKSEKCKIIFSKKQHFKMSCRNCITCSFYNCLRFNLLSFFPYSCHFIGKLFVWYFNVSHKRLVRLVTTNGHDNHWISSFQILVGAERATGCVGLEVVIFHAHNFSLLSLISDLLCKWNMQTRELLPYFFYDSIELIIWRDSW